MNNKGRGFGWPVASSFLLSGSSNSKQPAGTTSGAAERPVVLFDTMLRGLQTAVSYRAPTALVQRISFSFFIFQLCRPNLLFGATARSLPFCFCSRAIFVIFSPSFDFSSIVTVDSHLRYVPHFACLSVLCFFYFFHSLSDPIFSCSSGERPSRQRRQWRVNPHRCRPCRR